MALWLLVLAGMVFRSWCVDNGIATDHANKPLVGTWGCDEGVIDWVINIIFSGDGTAHLLVT